MGHKEEFIGFLTRSISEMSQDVKVLLEMFDDPEFEDGTRLRAAGALIYLIAPGDLIPDTAHSPPARTDVGSGTPKNAWAAPP